ncbi:hypothetical protein [Streptomyces sp. CBMA29]|uniref:hypothetical protein n=1 Tax=Streptomyces sp. CBMA29 TaxID=1896314 RepID=UPI0016621BB2|nr:hypothetical protein [Streptomyces sp. CBMA29]MBD0739412.1 hypothetical protein [Streptomyces sp. CBMA29]
MYELSRALLRSVGPDSARYENVLLDFSGVGPPVVTGNQGDIFDTEERPRRPASASVLYLENGGGKSVLIKLIFSVVLPGRRQVVGTRNTHALDGFVLPEDVSHVVLEWTHARSGKRLVTGKVSQWKDRRTADESSLSERWYHFRPGRTLDLESLPVEAEGKYLSLAQYCEELRLAQEAEPALGYRLFQLKGEWTDRLSALGLDPELFRYQRAMNNDEGEAADAFSLGSDAAFVSFLLSAVLPLGPAHDLAEVVATYATKLADRGGMELEKNFVEGALEALAPLVQAREARTAADEGLVEARTVLGRFIQQVQTRAAQEKDGLVRRDEEAVRLKDEVRRAEVSHGRATAVALELRRLVAELCLGEAQEQHARADREWAAAVEVSKGWQAVPAVLRDLEAASTVSRLRRRVGETEEAARPALVARDQAAHILAQALNAMVCRLAAEASDAETRAVEYSDQADAAQNEHDSAVAVAAEQEAKAGSVDERIAEVLAEIAAAVRDGLVPDGMAVADAGTLAESEARLNKERTGDLELGVERLEGEYRQACRQHEAAQSDLSEAVHAYDIACREHKAMDTGMRDLAADLRFAGVYGGELSDLDIEAAALTDRLAQAQEDAESVRLDVRITAAGDDRALTSLEVTDLLPPSLEAARVCESLNAGGVPSCTGWEYLASIPGVERREELVRRFPQLATGVLVNEADHVERAVEILASEGDSPTGFVALGTTSALMGGGGLPPGAAFVVPPHLALYDERAGQRERFELDRRRHEHQRRLAELDETLRTYAGFIARLTQWRKECPPGRLVELKDAMDTKEESARTVRETAGAVARTRDGLSARLRAAREEIPPLRDAQIELDSRAGALRTLLLREQRTFDWRTEALRARATAHEYREAAAAARTAAENNRLVAADARRRADALRATADRASVELAELPGQDTSDADTTVGRTPEQPLEVLRHAYRTAVDEYTLVAVGADLLADLRQAEREAAAAATGLTSFTETELVTARMLLDGPSGADAASRNAGRLRAERETAVLRERLDDLRAEVHRHRTALDGYAVPSSEAPVELKPFGRPRDVPHGERLIVAAEQSRDEAVSITAELSRHLDEAVQAQTDARQSTRAFKLLVDVFGEPAAELADESGTTQPYMGDAAGARERHDLFRGVYLVAQQAVTAAEADERACADRLAAHAGDIRFEELQSPGRRIMIMTERALLPARAAAWADDLRPRLRTLEIDLESIGRHREQIVRQLAQQVREALRTLKRAQRLSRLPEGLGNWSGQQFLQIGFADITDEVMHDRLGQVIDDAASEAQDKQSRRDARQLVLRGVEAAAAPKGFQVTVLKPDAVLAVQRVRVAQTKDIFSGGQILTAAIVLYCTMAALRANDRGRVGHQHSGVLFLDNPIGRASALYLLRLQQSVAKALGVQLIYTTGLYDKPALDVFPLVIRMRNDADLRARRRYLSVVDRRLASHLESLAEGPGGAVTAARYFSLSSDEAAAG